MLSGTVHNPEAVLMGTENLKFKYIFQFGPFLLLGTRPGVWDIS